MTATTDLLDVVVFLSNKHGETKKVKFLYHGNLKQVESYIYNLCQICALRLKKIISVYDRTAHKYLVGKK